MQILRQLAADLYWAVSHLVVIGVVVVVALLALAATVQLLRR